MDFETVESNIDEIIERYWKEDDEYYSEYRYDEEDKEFNMVKELEKFLSDNNVEHIVSEEEGFDSPGYENSFMAVAYKVNNGNNFGSQLGLRTVVFECM